MTLLDYQQRRRPIEPPDPRRVYDLYASRFVDRYDLGAQLWERLTCRDALAAFEHRLRSLPKRPLSVLDIGCGTGRNLQRLARADVDIDSYLGVDTSERMLHRAATNHPYSCARFVSADAIDTLGSERKHDLIVMTWVLSHHPDPAALIAVATKALAPAGRVLILALTTSDTIMGRAHAWRLRRFLHSNPIDPAILHEASPSFLGVSCRGLITIAEIPSRATGPVAWPAREGDGDRGRERTRQAIRTTPTEHSTPAQEPAVARIRRKRRTAARRAITPLRIPASEGGLPLGNGPSVTSRNTERSRPSCAGDVGVASSSWFGSTYRPEARMPTDRHVPIEVRLVPPAVFRR